MILADKIINERKKLGLSQEDLADRLDVSRLSVGFAKVDLVVMLFSGRPFSLPEIQHIA